jgi:tetratricopeptide (TPR) repeat protein
MKTRTVTTLLSALLLLVVPVLASAQGRAPLDAKLKRAQARIAKGQRLLTKGSFAGAEEAFREAMKLRPDVPGSYVGVGAALVGQKKFAEAIPLLKEAEEKFVGFERNLQSAQMQSQQWAGNRESVGISHVETTHPGADYSAQGTHRSMVDLIQERLAADPTLKPKKWSVEELSAIPAQVFYFEGVAYLRSGDRAAGVRALRQCLLIDPNYGLAHYNLAVAEFMAGHAKEAKGHLDAAVAAGVKANPKFVSDVDKAVEGAQ